MFHSMSESPLISFLLHFQGSYAGTICEGTLGHATFICTKSVLGHRLMDEKLYDRARDLKHVRHSFTMPRANNGENVNS